MVHIRDLQTLSPPLSGAIQWYCEQAIREIASNPRLDSLALMMGTVRQVWDILRTPLDLPVWPVPKMFEPGAPCPSGRAKLAGTWRFAVIRIDGKRLHQRHLFEPVARDVLAARKPGSTLRLHVLQRLLEAADARRAADNPRVEPD